jgi:hypothetical protein
MGKLFKVGILAAIIGGVVYAWKRMTGGSAQESDSAGGNEAPARRDGDHKS